MAISVIPRLMHCRRDRGFTVMESLVALAVASIVITAALPAMQDFIIRNRMSSEVNTFAASLYLARSEAVKRLDNVRLCPVDPDGDCNPTSKNWEQGWKVYYTDASGGQITLQQNPTLPNRFIINGNQSKIVYNPRGQANAGSYIFCDTGNVAQGRKVVVSDDGRTYIVKVSSSDCEFSNGGGN
jgi:type IV fimbrial biogenesis protein FimT